MDWKHVKLAAALTLAAASTTAAHAATDGALGATSQGTQTIVAQVSAAPQAQVRVSGLDDLLLAIKLGEVLTVSDDICFYHTSPTFSLTLVPDPRGPDHNFFLLNAAGDTLPVNASVILRFEQGGMLSFGVEPGHVNTGLTSNTQSVDCSSGVAASIEYQVFALNPARPTGTYTGTISLIMAAE